MTMSKTQTESKSTKEVIGKSLKHGITYADYRSRVSQLVEEGKTTGTEQSEALIEYTKLNDRRMKRFDKTVKIDEKVADDILKIDQKITMLVLTESWCGDAAPVLPVMNKITELNANLDLRIILRDKHLELMNRFLYNGTLSIPRLIIIDGETQEVLGDWGPRPSVAQQMAEDQKSKHGKLSADFKEDLQKWYNKDKGQNTIEDLTRFLLKNIGDSTLL